MMARADELAELQRLLTDGLASGVSKRTIGDVLMTARQARAEPHETSFRYPLGIW